MSDIVTDPTAFPRDFENALNEGDLERIVGLYDENAVLHVQTGDIHSGATAVRTEMHQLIVSQATITNTLRHTFQHDDIALIVVDYVLRLTAPDGNPVTITGTATNVIQNHPEKGWLMIIANPQGTA
jgi:ketosteroid isomerase-like protein